MNKAEGQFGDDVLAAMVRWCGMASNVVPADVQFARLTFLICGARGSDLPPHE